MTPDEAHLLAGIELNKIRSSVIEIERILRVLHQQRHPTPTPPPAVCERCGQTNASWAATCGRCGNTLPGHEALTPEVRAAIDETP
jgi:predicted amidophosphoribosyltransferase